MKSSIAKSYSVIVPHYEDAGRLARLLNSVPVERDDIELIVVDDCSPTQTAIDALRYRWPKVHWLSTVENSGAGVARNVGLDFAQGRWLVFADSDDEFLCDAFETFDRVLRQDDELVYFLAEAIQEADGSPSIRSDDKNELVAKHAESHNAVTQRQLCLQHVVPWAKVYSRSFIEAHQLRFDEVRLSNDVAFNVLAAVRALKVRAETIPVYRVYRRPESLTSNVSAAALMDRFQVERSLAERLATLGEHRARSATGYMLLSLRYGPRVTLRVWCLAIYSPMFIDWMRIFNLRRWRKFFMTRRSSEKERGQS